MIRRGVIARAGAVWWWGFVPPAFGQSCVPGWSGAFTTGDTPSIPSSFVVYDDGTGPKLHAAGAGPLWVGRWDGDRWTYAALEQWEPGGAFPEDSVRSMVEFDDGLGPRPALYVAGRFQKVKGVAASNIARWDGQSWSALGSGVQGSMVRTQCVFDDGTGAKLYVGGEFTGAGWLPGWGIARWDGAAWQSLGLGATGGGWTAVHVMAVHDDGAGDALFVGGDFTAISAVPAQNIARWNGGWAAVGGGLPALMGALVEVQEGPSRVLYANNQAASGPLAGFGIARWDGTAWSGVSGSEGWNAVTKLDVLDTGAGPQLHAALINEVGTSGTLLRRDGNAWTTLEPSLVTRDVIAFDHGAGPRLHQTGDVTLEGPGWTLTNEFFRVLDGGAWVRFGPEGFAGDVIVLDVIDIGGPALYAGGDHWSAGAGQYASVRRWDGSAWTSVGIGTPRTVHALSRYNDGSGPALYAGGHSRTVHPGGQLSYGPEGVLSRLIGEVWTPVPGIADTSSVYALSVYSDGTQVGLYAAGAFTHAGGLVTGSIARWRQGQWSALGSGITGTVRDLLVHDDGAGSSLFVAGEFAAAGGVPARSIARWDGQSWHALGSGLYFAAGSTPAPAAMSMVRWDDGAGACLYVTGGFDRAGGAGAKNIARWDGQAWSGLGPGLTGRGTALRGFDDGTGSALYAAGHFGPITLNLRRWTGTTWVGVGGGTSVPASALASFDDGSGPALWLGGSFVAAGNHSSGRIARWEACAPCYPDCTADGALSVADFGCFQSRYALALPYADCTGDGLFTVADFGCFQGRYVLGCP